MGSRPHTGADPLGRTESRPYVETIYFKDKAGNWWWACFGNDDQSPWREKPGVVNIDFDKDGKIRVPKDQPDFVAEEKRQGQQALWENPK